MILALFVANALAMPADDPITPAELAEALGMPLEGEKAGELADRIRAALPDGAGLQSGFHLVEGDQVAFLIEAEAEDGPPPRLDGMVTRQQGRELTAIAGTNLYATVMTIPTTTKFAYEFRRGRERVGGGTVEMADWKYPPESFEVEGRKYGTYKPIGFRSRTFGNNRTGWVYVPAAYDGTEPAALMIFQDGDAYKNERVGTVVENLIAEGAMPVTILALLNPGVNDDGRPNRSVEYDTLSDAYATFLADEVLPLLARDYRLAESPALRAIGGASSGGICSFTAAWQRPDLIGRVCSHIGSFTNIRGGGAYPDLVREAPRKPLVRVVLHDGRNDLINQFGDWWEANQRMREALEEKGYPVDFVADDSFHAYWSGGRVLPETLRLTWAGWPGEGKGR